MSTLSTNKVIPATSTTVSLGESGDTISIPSGVTLSNSGTATGFIGAWTLIGTNVASNSASLTQTGLDSTYDTYAIAISDILGASDDVSLRFQVGDSSGIDSGASDYAYHQQRSTSGSTSYAAYVDASSADIILGTGHGNATGEGGGYLVYLHRPGDGTTYPIFSWTGICLDASGVVTQHGGGGARLAVITLDRVLIKLSSGNITSGRMSVYGITHT
jgi:hypothetical protein